ncbi:hypothetical protein RB628_40980, partial [Streptomyces sp. ADMS]|uniref:hypothetical protein n=1 Tax=Streptomyces sp. ADMS TaxID=3071415 RepID=UPI00296E5153
PLGYEPSELPSCSTPRRYGELYGTDPARPNRISPDAESHNEAILPNGVPVKFSLAGFAGFFA